MAGKSIDDILRQQAAQRQAQIQQQQAQERALNEQRERQRQEHLQRMRMYEKLSNINPSAAAASSAAGGSRPNQAIPTINGHAELVLFKTSDLDNWQYVILDYLAETISDIKDTGIIKSLSTNISIVENTGFIVKFGSSNSTGSILFINDNAEIIKSVDLSVVSLGSRFRLRNYYIAYMSDGTVYHFDGKVVNTYSGLPEYSITDSVRSTKNGTLAISVIVGTDVTVYAWNPTIGLVSVWTGDSVSGDRYNGLVTYNDAEIFMITQFNDRTDGTDGWTKINVFGEDGSTKSSLDVSALNTVLNQGYDNYLGGNNVEYKFTRSGSTYSYYFNTYDADNDVWRSYNHAKGTSYASEDIYYQEKNNDGVQFTSLSNGVLHLLHDGTTQSAYNIDLYRHLDVVWSIDGGTYSSYTVNNITTATKGVDINDANRDGITGGSLYLGKSIFLPMWLNNSKISLLCLTSTQSIVIDAASTTNLTGSQGSGLIPGWNTGQQYASFRVGDNFGVWLAYASNDVYKIYNEFGANVISLTMSVNTRLNYTGDVSVVTDDNAGIEYVFTSNSVVLGLSPSYATYSTLGGISHYGLKPTYTDGDTTPSLMLNLNEGGLSRIFTDEDVYEFTLPETTWYRWLSDEYIVSEGRDGANYNLYFHDWTGTLLATIDTGITSGTLYNANLVKDRVYFKVVDGTTTTYYYFSPTKSDSVSVQNVTSSDVNYDYWPWWID
jgi:hypothetical protein